MNPAPSARTRLVALLGDPVDHSLSPAFQNAAFRAAGVDGVYLVLRCDAGSLTPLLRTVARAGGAGNVTVPHKARAARAVDRPSAAVQRTGACNTFWAEDGAVCGDNTDVAGVARALEELCGGAPAGADVLVLGAGGAAAAVLCALEAARAGRVTLLNRTADRARDLARRFAAGTLPLRVVEEPSGLAGQRFDLAVNATSLGLRADDPLPLEPGGSVGFAAALDLVYAPDRTAWVRACRAAGLAAEDGLPMLLYQGAAAFQRWWGREAPLAAMRAALPRRSEDERSPAAPPAA